MTLSLSSPLSLFSIPVVWFVGFYPVALKSSLIRRTAGFDNVEPRANVARLAQKKVSPEIAGRAARLEAAHMNGNEIYPLWGIAVLAANYAKMDNQTLNILSLSFIGLRVLYNFIYANQKNQFHGSIRTLVWMAGTSLPLYILIKAANAVRLA
ncbi:hypothetical protein FPV67DRAFT_1669114 [Lyophyllum atratum]|nr:hypothetical protein FPV67DRAFT_1669114 [Lyophyllum atratum]